MKVRYIILFLVLVLVFGFGLFTSCRAEEIIEESAEEEITEPVEEEIVEEPIEEPTEEEIVEEIVEEKPVEEPEPIILSGSGDSIVDIEKLDKAMVVHIIGNKSSNHFAVINYDKEGERIELLVNTTEPYDGIRPLDFENGEWTSRFEVNATGSWTIEVLPLSSLRILSVPGSIKGKGDEVFLLMGNIPDLAKITGNAKSSHFAVLGYNGGRDLLVNTTEPYEGTVMLNKSTFIIEVIAIDNWAIEVSAK